MTSHLEVEVKEKVLEIKINKPKVPSVIIFLLFFTRCQCANKLAASKIEKGLINSEGLSLIHI